MTMTDFETTTPSLVSQMCIFDRYGARLDTDQLADLMGQTRGSVLNQISAGTFPIPTYLDGKRRYADFRDVAAHLDAMRALAHRQSPQGLGAGLPA